MTAQATAVNVTATGAVLATPGTLRGWSLASTPGATVTLFDNATGASGTVLGVIVLGAAAAASHSITDGLRCANGIWLVATAAITGSIWVG